MDWMPQAVRDGIIVVLVISGPLVLAAAAIGLIIGILQAATQVQEQTIGSALKIIGVFAIIIFAGFWMYQYLNQYTARTISTAFTFIPRQTQKAVPSDAFGEKKFKDRFSEKMDEAPPGKRLKVIAPEKLDIEKLEGGAPIGSPLLAAPEVPSPPQAVKLVPPPIPKIPVQVVKPDLMLSEIKEPVMINPPSEDIQQKQINLVPGNPIKNKDEQKVFSANNDDNPSWLE